MRWADFGPDAGQAAELVDEVLDRAGVHGSRLSRGGRRGRRAAEAAHGLLADGLGLGHGVVDGGEHEVLQHLDVVGVDAPDGVDGHGAELHRRR